MEKPTTREKEAKTASHPEAREKVKQIEADV